MNHGLNTTHVRAAAMEGCILLSNFLSHEITFALGWFVIDYLPSQLRGEAMLNWYVLAIYYQPVIFVILYVPIRSLHAVVRLGPGRLTAVLGSYWLIGILTGMLSLLAYLWTPIYRILTPLLAPLIE